MMNWDEWRKIRAENRIKMYDAASKVLAELPKADVELTLTQEQVFVIRNLAFAEHRFCCRCEEIQPDLMNFETEEYLTEEAWQDQPHKAAIEKLRPDMSVCAWCIVEEETQQACIHCGVQDYMVKYRSEPPACSNEGGHEFDLLPIYKEGQQ